MLDQFLPQESRDRVTVARVLKENKNKNIHTPQVAATGSWPREVGIQRVVWNAGNGLTAAGLLASSTGSGLCRVDNLWGRWFRDRVLYGSAEAIRLEKGNEAMDVDSDDSAASL